jgi:hypothetical protein
LDVQISELNKPSAPTADNALDAVNAPSAAIAPKAVNAAIAPKAVNAVAKHPTSPEKDFTKVANSIFRQIPNGLFTGKSKFLYDHLYSLTRGAIKPIRSVRISKSSLMKGAGIKSVHTFYNNMRHLESIGLVLPTRIDGERGGNIYEVFLPEEINHNLVHLVQLGQVSQLSQEPPVAVSAETALGALGSEPTNTGVSDASKTSFKDKNETSDDEAFAGLTKILAESFERISGKKANHSDGGKLIELAELLVMELELAAARTKSVSNAPAFLTEHLRRRLMSNPSQPKVKNKSTQIGKQNPAEPVETYQAEPLTEKAKETTLKAFISYLEKGQKDYVLTLEDSYTKEDWRWLMEQISEK